MSAIQAMLLSTLFFAGMNTGVKALPGISFIQIAFFRTLISFLLCILQANRDNISLKGNQRGWLILRGVFGTTGLFCYYYCVQHMPLATAVTLQHLSPIFSLLLAVALLHERPTFWQWMFVALGFVGVLILKGFDARVGMLGVGLGVFGAFTSACAYNIVRRSSGTNPPVVIVFYFTVVALVVSTPLLLSVWTTPTGIQILWLCFVGLCTHFAQVYMTTAYQMEKVTNLSHLNYLGVVYAILIGFFFFNEGFSREAMFGVILILITSYLSTRDKFKKNK